MKNQTGAIDLSVVIATRERWPLLKRTLDSLAEQEMDRFVVEVVVVDNFSRDGSDERVEELADAGSFPVSLSFLRAPARGPGAARNTGLAAARGRLVLFLDDDCRPARRDLLAGHVGAHRRGSPRLVMGPLGWDPSEPATAVMAWLARAEAGGTYLRGPRDGRVPLSIANVSVPRDELLTAGGFDQRFQHHGLEGHELALRLADRGLGLELLPELEVHHADRLDLEEVLRRTEHFGRALHLLERLRSGGSPRLAPPRGLPAFAARALARPLGRAVRAGQVRTPRARSLALANFASLARGYAAMPLPDLDELRGGPRSPGPSPSRPPVSLVMPFAGDERVARETVEGLRSLRLGPADEVVIVDNGGDGMRAAAPLPGVQVVEAREEHSSYYARNVGAQRARNEWLLFMDADCRPGPTLLDDFFAAPIAESAGALAGLVLDPREPDTWAGRYASARRRLSQDFYLGQRRRHAVTACLLVRRSAWAAVGGFVEGVRSGGDVDFSFRLQDAGWSIELVRGAAVEHLHRDRLRPLTRQQARYGAGRAWLNRRFPGSVPRPRVDLLPRSLAGIVVWGLTARVERLIFRLIDTCVIAAETLGYLLSNAPESRGRWRLPEPVTGAGGLVVLVDFFPEVSETFVVGEVRALGGLGCGVRVESLARPMRPAFGGARGLGVSYLEDDPVLRRVGSLGWLVGRHPVRSFGDLWARRRWRREEEVVPLRALAPVARRLAVSGERHLHVHFAAVSALNALRLGRLLGVSYSVTAHAYDIFLLPRNLREKLERAAFVTSGCGYNVEYLRGLVAPERRDRIHELVMGVDGERFRRRQPLPGGRTVVAVGRLVEKKGFRYLVEAAGLLEREEPLERLVIAGEGPLRSELEQLVERLGLAGRVELVGLLEPDGVRELLERADLFACPSVVAADGDRDSMPVVVKEALAMELPVVASDEVGLPEIVRPEFGRLVPPADPQALANAIKELLALTAHQRAELGKAGRTHALQHANLKREAERLVKLMALGPV